MYKFMKNLLEESPAKNIKKSLKEFLKENEKKKSQWIGGTFSNESHG